MFFQKRDCEHETNGTKVSSNAFYIAQTVVFLVFVLLGMSAVGFDFIDRIDASVWLGLAMMVVAVTTILAAVKIFRGPAVVVTTD
jgi:hypothetical protein